MPFDPTNAPFGRPAAYREARFPSPALPSTSVYAPQTVETTLKAESMLLEEFNAASVEAYQAKAESAGLVNLYLLSAGALATGLGVVVNAYSPASRVSLELLQTLMLTIAGILSFAFFVRFLDLARDYRSSAATMSAVRDFYVERLRPQMPDIGRALRRGERDSGGGLGRGNGMMTCVIVLLGSLCFAGAAGHGLGLLSIGTNHRIADLAIGGVALPFSWEALAGLIAVLAHLAYYRMAGSHSAPH